MARLPQVDKDRLRVRRRMAIASFLIVLLSLPTVLLMCFFGDVIVADNLLKASGIITPVILFLTGLVIQYGHYSQQQDMNGTDSNKE